MRICCIYCFARPTHSYLNLSPGLDFETRIIAKVNAAASLRTALSSPSYKALPLNLGSATDAYQPAERRLRITRSVIEVLSEYRHAFSLITKSSLVERDLDLIAPMAAERLAAAYVSITTLDPALARAMVPRAAAPSRRWCTIEALAKAGVPVGVSVSPVIPFLNVASAVGGEPAVPAVARAALPRARGPDHGARQGPARRARQRRTLRDRMTGQGVWAGLLRQRFDMAARRLGLNRKRIELDLSRFERPAAPAAQGRLF